MPWKYSTPFCTAPLTVPAPSATVGLQGLAVVGGLIAAAKCIGVSQNWTPSCISAGGAGGAGGVGVLGAEIPNPSKSRVGVRYWQPRGYIYMYQPGPHAPSRAERKPPCLFFGANKSASKIADLVQCQGSFTWGKYNWTHCLISRGVGEPANKPLSFPLPARCGAERTTSHLLFD